MLDFNVTPMFLLTCGNPDIEPGRGQERPQKLRPFDETDSVSVEELLEPDIVNLLHRFDPVEVEVIHK